MWNVGYHWRIQESDLSGLCDQIKEGTQISEKYTEFVYFPIVAEKNKPIRIKQKLFYIANNE